MELRDNCVSASPSFPRSAGSFCTQQNSDFRIPEPANGSKPERRCLRICGNSSRIWARRKAPILVRSRNTSKFAMPAIPFKLTLRSQAPYTFSS